MDMNLEHMVDVTMDAVLTVAEINHFGRTDEQLENLRSFGAEIDRFFGFSETALTSHRKHQLNKMLRTKYLPIAGEHETFYDPYPRVHMQFKSFECYVAIGAEPEAAKEFCLLLNQLFLDAWSANGSRHRLTA